MYYVVHTSLATAAPLDMIISHAINLIGAPETAVSASPSMYTRPSCWRVVSKYETVVKSEQRVGPDLNVALMLKSLHTLLIISLMPVAVDSWWPPSSLSPFSALAVDNCSP